MMVVVLAGGISTERDVSLISGKMIYQAMKRLGHQAVLLDVFLGMERDDIDHIFESDEDFSAGIEAIHEINPDISAVKALRKDGGKCYFGPNVIRICQMADVVFLGLHGADGEIPVSARNRRVSVLSETWSCCASVRTCVAALTGFCASSNICPIKGECSFNSSPSNFACSKNPARVSQSIPCSRIASVMVSL